MGLLDKAKRLQEKKKTEQKELIPKKAAQQASKATAQHAEESSNAEPFETDLDKLYEMVQQKGKVTLQEAASYFSLSLNKIESYAQILQNQGLLQVRYPAMGKSFLTLLEDKTIAKKKQNKKVKLILFGVILIAVLVGLYFLLKQYNFIY